MQRSNHPTEHLICPPWKRPLFTSCQCRSRRRKILKFLRPSGKCVDCERGRTGKGCGRWEMGGGQHCTHSLYKQHTLNIYGAHNKGDAKKAKQQMGWLQSGAGWPKAATIVHAWILGKKQMNMYENKYRGGKYGKWVDYNGGWADRVGLRLKRRLWEVSNSCWC